MASAESRPCCCSRAASRSPRRWARPRAARSSNGSRVTSSSFAGRLGPFQAACFRSELQVPWKVVLRLEPRHLAPPENVKGGLDRARLIERRHTEVDRLRLVIDLHEE